MTANLLKTIPVAIAWMIFLWRVYIAHKERKNSPPKLGGLSQKVIWIPFLLLLLAGTTWNDIYIQSVSIHIGKWFLYIPRVTLGIAALLVYTYSNAHYQLMPERYLPLRRKWTIAAGLLTIVDFALLQWLGWYLYPDRLFEFERLAGLILKSYLLVLILRTAMPYVRWCQIHEQGIIFRIRLGIIWWAIFSFAIWMCIDLAALILGLGTESSLLAVPFVIIFLIALSLGIVISDRFYERYLVFPYHLNTFLRIRLVELVAYHELGSVVAYTPFPVSFHAVLQAPEHATYKSVISVLDCSKILCAQPEGTLASNLGKDISRAYTVDSNYLAVVNHLWEVEAEYLMNIKFLKVLFRLLLAQFGKSMRLGQAVSKP